MEEKVLRVGEVYAMATIANGCVLRETFRDSKDACAGRNSAHPRLSPGSVLSSSGGDSLDGSTTSSSLSSLSMEARNRLLSLNSGVECDNSSLVVSGERLTLAMRTPSTLLYVSKGHGLGAIYAVRGVLEYFVLARDLRKDVAARILGVLEEND